MDHLIASLDKLLKYKTEDPSRFYTFLSDCGETDDKQWESLIPKIYYLYERQVLRKDLVYLSLLASQNHALLGKFIDYDKSIYSLDVSDPVSLYDYHVYKKQHWVYEIIDNPGNYPKLVDLKNIYNKFQMIKFVKETNLSVVEIDQLESLTREINFEFLDDFWKFYVEEITRFISTVKFCKTLKTDANDSDLFVFASKNTPLDTLSRFTDLGDATQWENISSKLACNHDQFIIFTGFTILATLINLLIDNYNPNLKKDHINALFETLKSKLIDLKDKQLQIELLENIFRLMFHRKAHEFTCKEKEIRFVLFLLKSVTEELKLKKVYERDSDHYRRLSTLSNYVTDALWRLDLILNTKITPKIQEQLLNYMLAPPESLIHICLKRQNFERAHQVIEIFDLRDSDLANEVNYAEIFLKFRKTPRKNAKSVVEFFESNSPHDLFTNIFDLAITGTQTWDQSEILLNLSGEKLNSDETLSNFYKRVSEIGHEVGPKDNVSLPEILISPNYPLDVASYRAKEAFFEDLARLYDEFNTQNRPNDPGNFNKNHPNHKTFLKMNDLVVKYLQDRETTQYLLRIFNYLKAFSKILYIEQNSSDIISKGKNTSYFDIFNFNRSELTGKLLFERQLDPTEFEKYFGKLKLDFLYHVVGNCFPTINLHVQENVTIEELYHDNMLYIPSRSIIIYIQKRNWLLAFILNEMYKVEGVKIDISEVRLRTFFNYLKSPRIQHLKAIFDKNDIIAALQNCINAQKVKLYFRERIVEHDLVSIQSQNSSNSDGFETGEEIQEDAKTTNWRTLYDIIESIPENQMKKKSDLIICKDNVLVNMVQDGFEPEYYKYAYFIANRDLRIDTILNNFKKWPGKFAGDIIKSEISRFDCLMDSKMETLRDWLQQIELNEELKNVFEVKSWYKSYNFCREMPENALDKILQTNNVDFLLDFIQLYQPSTEILCNINSSYLSRIMDLNTPLDRIKKLLDSLPFEHAIDMCHNLLTILRNLEYLQFVADYLNTNVSDDLFLKNVQISLKMLSVFAPLEQDQLFCLLNEPLSILEVLLMNTKLDKLAAILHLLNTQHNLSDFTDVITTEKIDELLRKYAEKSLDFRVITHPNPGLFKTPEPKLLQSLDSLSLMSDKRQFVVPENVPTKEEWVQNDEVVECMCCHQVAFSMFNRRHHCRRCGRVVCYNCSLKRMFVPSYGDILVRVCSDCYNQTIGEKNDSNSEKSRSFIQEYWLLNDDPEHNKIIREEFSYEHAPSTSLCFSILRYHSKSVEYPKFLLEQCEVMLKLLQPNQEVAQEIDYLLVIKMLKSLATAAKMVSAENMLQSGASMADRILYQTELLALLAERGCLSLMPSQNIYVDANVLRRLRDKLLQREQWNLALEVSTKAGLDNTGVFAAWGKSCLKAGSLLLAREKFQRCLDKNSQYETSSNLSRLSELNSSLDSLTFPRSRISSRVSSGSFTSESKPLKDPPLLYEIIQILETKTRTINPKVVEKAQSVKISGSVTSLNQLPYTVHIDTALSIVNRVKNLKEIASGNYSLTGSKKFNCCTSRPTIDPIFYDECIYYLGKYGTHLSLLEFYIRHGEIHTALIYILECHLPSETFIEVYMKCLKDGMVAILQEHMSRIDSSLELWKDHLKNLCRHLEKQQLLNSLYQLQLYIGDYVRASMTCIRFYQDGVKTFTELANNVGFLHKGEEHLRQILEQEQWVEVTSVTSKDSFEERLLTNSDLVMKIETKDVNRHINTVKRQVEVMKFLAEREASGVNTRDLILAKDEPIPTLFGSTLEKINLAVLAIISGEAVEDGFNLATKIIEDFKLRPIKVYCLAGKQLAKSERYNGITQLVNCIKSTGINDSAISDMLDEMLAHAVGTLIKENVGGTKVEDLIKLINDKATKISAYIEAKQLKTAYFLAVKYKRTADIRRIQREAELLNMPTIKALCQKVLQNSPHTSKD
ncbi:zinc finger FYVE domain-containing protein 26 [Tribolium madens]|uniref:zinc finger FYVE domain-containing protein 26 n=1 Tax=Tribolium madens TaxID=41895 RepID=UPI001CF7360E|nr:zinc finger FYVE domain-containing protein 26 [Tribolium madens]